MGESFKAICSLVFIVGMIVAAVVWFDDKPNHAVWITRIVAPLIAILSLALLLAVHLRRDVAPDYLQKTMGGYFNRGGFCFAFATEVVDGVCHFHAYFQNQYDQPCIGQIALRPGSGFFLTRAKIDTIAFEIPCDGGAFGVATLPFALPKKVQGKQQKFEVGASVEYPNGKGQRLRFRDGVFLRTNTNFGNAFGTALTIAGAFGGAIVLSSPASVTIKLPTNVSEELAQTKHATIETFWRLGDPLLTG